MTAAGFRILLIEDDVAYAEEFIYFAAKQGLKIQTVNSLKALGSVGAIQKFDLVMFDYHLPDVSGFEIAEYCEAFFKNKPVILISQTPPSDLSAFNKLSCLKLVIPKAKGLPYITEQILALLPMTIAANKGQPQVDVV